MAAVLTHAVKGHIISNAVSALTVIGAIVGFKLVSGPDKQTVTGVTNTTLIYIAVAGVAAIYLMRAKK